MLLAYACHKDFILFQMDVKSAFLNGYIIEKVYVKQPPDFENENFQIMCINCLRHYMD